MKLATPTDIERSDELDQWSAAVASSVDLRQANTRNWLDLELGLWMVVSMNVEAWQDGMSMPGRRDCRASRQLSTKG